jgi:hypothetical protein
MNRDRHLLYLFPLVEAALHSPGLLPPNEFNLARYSPHLQARNRLLDPDVLALEDYLIDHVDLVAQVCQDEATPLQIGYQYMSWLLIWLNTHYLPTFFTDDPESPLQVLSMAAAQGIGEWAAANNQIEDGLESLLAMTNGSLWRVREAGVWGLRRLLARSWERTLLRLRYQMLIANPAEWWAMIACWCDDPDPLLGGHPERLLDILDLLQNGLRFWITLEADRRQAPTGQLLEAALQRAAAALVPLAPELIFAQMGVWALWDVPEVKAILRANLTLLGAWSDSVAALERQL